MCSKRSVNNNDCIVKRCIITDTMVLPNTVQLYCTHVAMQLKTKPSDKKMSDEHIHVGCNQKR